MTEREIVEVVTIMLTCGHQTTQINPSPKGAYHCGRCDALRGVKYGIAEEEAEWVDTVRPVLGLTEEGT